MAVHCSRRIPHAGTISPVISRISDRPAGKEACLVVIYGLDLGKKYNVDRPSIVIGRSSKADIQIDQESVSRNHCLRMAGLTVSSAVAS